MSQPVDPNAELKKLIRKEFEDAFNAKAKAVPATTERIVGNNAGVDVELVDDISIVELKDRGYWVWPIPKPPKIRPEPKTPQVSIKYLNYTIYGGGGGGGGGGAGANSAGSVSGGGGGGGAGGGDAEMIQGIYPIPNSTTHIGFYVGRGGKGGRGGRGVSSGANGNDGQEGNTGRPSFIFAMELQGSEDFGENPENPSGPAVPKTSTAIAVADIAVLAPNKHPRVNMYENEGSNVQTLTTANGLLKLTPGGLKNQTQIAINGQPIAQGATFNVWAIDWAQGGLAGNPGLGGTLTGLTGGAGGAGGNGVQGYFSISSGGGGGGGSLNGLPGAGGVTATSPLYVPLVDLGPQQKRPNSLGTGNGGFPGNELGTGLGGGGGNSYVNKTHKYGLGGTCGEFPPPVVDFAGDLDPEPLFDSEESDNVHHDPCDDESFIDPHGLALGGAGGAGAGWEAWRNGANCSVPVPVIQDCEECVPQTNGACCPAVPMDVIPQPGAAGGGGAGGAGMYVQGSDSNHLSGNGGNACNGITGLITFNVTFQSGIMRTGVIPDPSSPFAAQNIADSITRMAEA